MKKKHLNEMAFEPGDYPNLVNKQKQEWIESGGDELASILPNLSGEEQSYLELITSSTYQEILQRIEKYLGIDAKNLNFPAFYGILFKTLEEVKKLEFKYKDELEEMALTTVLSIPEFKMVKKMYDSGDVKFDVKIGSGELERAVSKYDEDPEEETEEGVLTEEEEINAELAEGFGDVQEKDMQRKLANILIQGGSTTKLYLFNMVNDSLLKINKFLPKAYGVLATGAQIGYWVTPNGIEKAQASSEDSSTGSSEVIPEDDIYIIKARGMTFPYLVHEIAKGIYEWISIDPSMKQAMKQVDTLEGETQDMLVGPGIYKTIISYVPLDKQELLPLIQKYVIRLSKEEVKEVLGKTAKGRSIMKGLLLKAEEAMAEYDKEDEEDEETFDFDNEDWSKEYDFDEDEDKEEYGR